MSVSHLPLRPWLPEVLLAAGAAPDTAVSSIRQRSVSQNILDAPPDPRLRTAQGRRKHAAEIEALRRLHAGEAVHSPDKVAGPARRPDDAKRAMKRAVQKVGAAAKFDDRGVLKAAVAERRRLARQAELSTHDAMSRFAQLFEAAVETVEAYTSPPGSPQKKVVSGVRLV